MIERLIASPIAHAWGLMVEEDGDDARGLLRGYAHVCWTLPLPKFILAV